jgi:hypothetical protein
MTKTRIILSPKKAETENILKIAKARQLVRDRIRENAPTNVSASPAIARFDPPLGPRRKRKRDR